MNKKQNQISLRSLHSLALAKLAILIVPLAPKYAVMPGLIGELFK
jgi:hypothetical protein